MFVRGPKDLKRFPALWIRAMVAVAEADVGPQLAFPHPPSLVPTLTFEMESPMDDWCRISIR